jgi:hypothetical protein
MLCYLMHFQLIQVYLKIFFAEAWDFLCPFSTFMGHTKDIIISGIAFFLPMSIKYDILVIGGDMNMTLNYREVWGDSVRSNRLFNFFQSHFEASIWVDIEAIKLRPTWNNNICGQDTVGKRLDYFVLIYPYLESGKFQDLGWKDHAL